MSKYAGTETEENLKEMPRKVGNVIIAAIFIKVMRRRKNARYARTQRHTLKEKQKIIRNNDKKTM